MPDGEPSVGRDEDELEITDLRPVSAGDRGGDVKRPRGETRAWQRRVIGLSLVALVGVLLVAVLLSGPLSAVGDALWGRARALASPSPTEVALLPTATLSAALPPPPAPPLTAPTTLPGVSGVPALGPAPASCGGMPPALTEAGPPHWGWAIGHAPVLLGGFIGPYATLPLGPAASAMAYGWAAPYTPYGWPAPIGLVLRSGFSGGTVTLSGWDPRTGHPLWFGFVTAGEWGAPSHVVPAFTLDPAHPSVPVGGSAVGETFWYGYAFLPRAGCYTFAADWPGGGWRVTVSSGTVSAGG
jgi:hypothetical protein